jgi:hypothetical protein
MKWARARSFNEGAKVFSTQLSQGGMAMKKLIGLMALALLLSFSTSTLVFAGDPTPAPAPTDEQDKKNPSGPKADAGDEKKDEKKDDKGGK